MELATVTPLALALFALLALAVVLGALCAVAWMDGHVTTTTGCPEACHCRGTAQHLRG